MQKSKQKYHISMEKYNIKKGLIVYTCIVLVFGGCIQAINDKYIKEQLTLLFVDLLLIEAFLAVTFSVQFFQDGYIIRHDEIVFFHKFKKNRKKLKEIEAVVISNAYIYFHGTNPINMWKNGKIIPCPWFTLFFEKIDPMEVGLYPDKVTSIEIENKIFKSKQKVGFIYQKDVIDEIMEKYTGNIYITKSLYLNFKNEIDERAATKSIHII